MSKAPPSFDFFPNDFLGGTTHFTTEEIGAYILLLLYQYANGSIPNNENVIRRIIRCTDSVSFVSIWDHIKEKFEPIDDDMKLLKNSRMEAERQRKTRVWLAHVNSGKLGGRPRKPNGSKMVNQNKTITEVGSRKKEVGSNKKKKGMGTGKSKTKFVQPTFEQVNAYVIEIGKAINPQRFIDHYTSKGWRIGKNQMVDWKASVRSWDDDPKLITATATKLWDDQDTDLETGKTTS